MIIATLDKVKFLQIKGKFHKEKLGCLYFENMKNKLLGEGVLD